MRKFNVFFLLLISIFAFTAVTTVNATDGATEIAGARYLAEEVAEYNELPYGVVHTREIGSTSTSISGYDADGFGGRDDTVEVGKYYPQQVNVLEVPSNEQVKVTSWANLTNHKWTLTTVKGLISDYESKNDGWKVVAAVNQPALRPITSIIVTIPVSYT